MDACREVAHLVKTTKCQYKSWGVASHTPLILNEYEIFTHQWLVYFKLNMFIKSKKIGTYTPPSPAPPLPDVMLVAPHSHQVDQTASVLGSLVPIVSSHFSSIIICLKRALFLVCILVMRQKTRCANATNYLLHSCELCQAITWCSCPQLTEKLIKLNCLTIIKCIYHIKTKFKYHIQLYSIYSYSITSNCLPNMWIYLSSISDLIFWSRESSHFCFNTTKMLSFYYFFLMFYGNPNHRQIYSYIKSNTTIIKNCKLTFNNSFPNFLSLTTLCFSSSDGSLVIILKLGFLIYFIKNGDSWYGLLLSFAVAVTIKKVGITLLFLFQVNQYLLANDPLFLHILLTFFLIVVGNNTCSFSIDISDSCIVVESFFSANSFLTLSSPISSCLDRRAIFNSSISFSLDLIVFLKALVSSSSLLICLARLLKIKLIFILTLPVPNINFSAYCMQELKSTLITLLISARYLSRTCVISISLFHIMRGNNKRDKTYLQETRMNLAYTLTNTVYVAELLVFPFFVILNQLLDYEL
ncbi:hypothetical protein AGLY_013319 [Aphis glycines]|uniref:Uncharacterized protein n=1 Tax=Aphis glycines TaxID=307491 RepID=A0A6G0T5Z5_APHGL|nr:hypothetical protein AGLY_013319 [Aphis glycines]